MDKGCRSAADNFRAVIPHKKPLWGALAQYDVKFNRKLSSDRIIVQSSFGDMDNCRQFYLGSGSCRRIYAT